MAKALPLTTNEQLTLMRRLLSSKGLAIKEASKLAKLAITDKDARRRWLQLQTEFSEIKSNAQNRKLTNRSDGAAKGLLRNLSEAVSKFDLYKAQAKQASACNEGGEIHRLFLKKGKLTKHEQICLLSHSKQSAMKPLSTSEAQYWHLADDQDISRTAYRFCQRFGLTV